MVSLELEVEVKVQKPLGDEDVRDMENDRIIGKDILSAINLNDESKYEYRRFTLNLEDVKGRGDFDGVHTVIYLPFGTFLIKMDYDKFNHIYEAMTGVVIRKQSDFVVTKRK